MTTTPTAEPPGRGSQPQNWGGIAVGYANEISGAAFGRGDLAALRRMDPGAPDAAAFYRLLARRELLGNETVELKWALILHGIALMTRTANDGQESPSAHDRAVPVGQALFKGGDASRSKGFYSETRLNRLLTAREEMLRTLLARLFRMLANEGCAFDWREMARFILYDGYDEEAAERSRRRIARDYYRAERQAAPPSNESD